MKSTGLIDIFDKDGNIGRAGDSLEKELFYNIVFEILLFEQRFFCDRFKEMSKPQSVNLRGLLNIFRDDFKMWQDIVFDFLFISKAFLQMETDFVEKESFRSLG